MLSGNVPIRKRLLRIILFLNGIVLLVTCVTLFIYEFYIFRKTTLEKLSTIGKIISANSTAALAFLSAEDARETLAALQKEPHIIAACLYDKDGNLFAEYTSDSDTGLYHFPEKPQKEGYHFSYSFLEGFEPVVQHSKVLGTLYLRSDLKAMYDRLRPYAFVVALAIVLSILLSFFLSRRLIKSISTPHLIAGPNCQSDFR